MLLFWVLGDLLREKHVLCQAQRGESLAQGWRLGLPTGGKDSGAYGICANPISDTHTQITGREVSWLLLSTLLHFRGQGTCWIQHTEHLELSSSSLLQKNCQECDDLVSSWRRLSWWAGLSLKLKEAGGAWLPICCYTEENFHPSLGWTAEQHCTIISDGSWTLWWGVSLLFPPIFASTLGSFSVFSRFLLFSLCFSLECLFWK